MSKLVFEDKSYIECRKSDAPDKILIIISAKDYENPSKKIVNSCEITLQEFNKLISDINNASK